MHSTLQKIVTWGEIVELPPSQLEQPETETFYEDDTTEDRDPPRTVSKKLKSNGSTKDNTQVLPNLHLQ
jgi:hypothetical protein